MVSTQKIPTFVHDDLSRLGVDVSETQLERLNDYLDFLLETNRKFNLTAVRDRDEAWGRHIIDSLTLIPFIENLPANASVIDVGAGGGLPGVPLGIVRPDLKITLLEATGKKARFLDDCVHELELTSSHVVCERAETIGQQREHRQMYDCVVCRAIGAMNVLLELTLPLLRVEGRLLAMKGPSIENELENVGDALGILGAGEIQVFDAYPDGFDRNSVIVCVDKACPTPPEYPRKPGIPRQSPL